MTTDPLSCREAARRLWALLDDDLVDDERRAVLEHLHSCDECDSHRRHAIAFRRAVRRTRARFDPPQGLVPMVRRALHRAAGGS